MTDKRAHTLFEVREYIRLNPHATPGQIARNMQWHDISRAHHALAALRKLGLIEHASRHAARV